MQYFTQTIRALHQKNTLQNNDIATKLLNGKLITMHTYQHCKWKQMYGTTPWNIITSTSKISRLERQAFLLSVVYHKYHSYVSHFFLHYLSLFLPNILSVDAGVRI